MAAAPRKVPVATRRVAKQAPALRAPAKPPNLGTPPPRESPRLVVLPVQPDEPRPAPGPVLPTGWLVAAAVVGAAAPVVLVILAMTGHSQLDQVNPAINGARGLYLAAGVVAVGALGFGILLALRFQAPLAWFGVLLGAAIYLLADSDLRSYGPFYNRSTATLVLAMVASVLVAAASPLLNSARRGMHPATPAAGILIAYGLGFAVAMTVLVVRLQQEAQNAAQANQNLGAPAIWMLLVALAFAGLVRRRAS